MRPSSSARRCRPLLWGVAFANIVAGVPIDKDGNFTGNLFTLLNPYGLLGGAVTLTLFLTHGAAYIALKTEGELRARANKWLPGFGLVAAVRAVVFLAWTQKTSIDLGLAPAGTAAASSGASVVAAVALLLALAANRFGREGWAFIGTGADDRPGGRGAVPRPLPQRHAVHDQPRLQPDGAERFVHGLHPLDHDGRRGHLHARWSCSTRVGPTGCSASE